MASHRGLRSAIAYKASHSSVTTTSSTALPNCAIVSSHLYHRSSTPKPSKLNGSAITTRSLWNTRLQNVLTSPPQSSIVARRFYADHIVKVPEMAESITEGTLKQWSKQIGDHVEQDEEIATIETDKIDVAVNAPQAGTVKEFLAEEENTVTVGQDLVKLELGESLQGGGKEQASQEPKAPASGRQATSSDPRPNDGGRESIPDVGEKPQGERGTPTPAPAQEPTQKTDTSQPLKEDTTNRDEQAPPPSEDKKRSEPKTADSKASGMSAPLGDRGERRVKMNRMRLRIAERLKQSQNTAASLTTFNEVDMSSMMQLRKLYKDDILKKTGVKLGFMSAFTKACVLAMKDIPAVNASIEGPNGGDTIVYRDYVDISVAVATDKGLVTPVVRNAETMDLVGIERAIADLGKKARDNKLTIEDMAGGSFTISNGGVFGSLMGTPIINLPQTAVLGLHAIKEKPVAVDGKVEIRPMMYLALTYDHRLLDGREAVVFLVKVKEFIEDPRRILLT